MLAPRFRLYRFLTLSILLFCVVFIPACTRSENNNTERTPVLSGPPSTTYPMPPLKGKSVSELGWELSDGEHNILSDYRGKVLVLDFYATWCGPCRQSVPHLIELQRRYEKDGLKIVGLNVGGPDDQERVSDFARELGIQYTLALPDDALISLLLSDSNSIPQTFIFDRNGELMKRFIGYGPASENEIGQVVESALKSPATQVN
jgi:thiol-disulfide isomerase/thioredoxin